MAPYPEISCYPPLNQLTIVNSEDKQVSFTVFVEWNKARPPYPFNFLLCYSNATEAKHESEWSTLPLKPLEKLPLTVRDPTDENQRTALDITVDTSTLLAGADASQGQHMALYVEK